MFRSVFDFREKRLTATASASNGRNFDPKEFLGTSGDGRKVVIFLTKPTIFTQGDAADAVFYIQEGKVKLTEGKVKLTVVSKIGKEATLGILSDGALFGEGALAGQALRMGSATAMTDCELLRIDKKNDECPAPRTNLLRDVRSVSAGPEHRYEEDLVDHLFNSS